MGLYCKTCNDWHDTHFNHRPDLLRELMTLVNVLSDLGRVSVDINNRLTSDFLDLKCEVGGQILDLSFFIVHNGHDLAIRDEYSRLWVFDGKRWDVVPCPMVPS